MRGSAKLAIEGAPPSEATRHRGPLALLCNANGCPWVTGILDRSLLAWGTMGMLRPPGAHGARGQGVGAISIAARGAK